MAGSVEGLKTAGAFLRSASEKNSNPDTRALLADHATTVEWAADEIVRLKGLTSALPPDLGNIHDLPTELLEELSVAKGDELEDQLVTTINAYGGEASLDQILVGLYRKFHVLQKRRFIQNKLYRMEMVWSVDGKKGFYSTTKPKEDAGDETVGKSRTKSAIPFSIDDEVPF